MRRRRRRQRTHVPLKVRLLGSLTHGGAAILIAGFSTGTILADTTHYAARALLHDSGASAQPAVHAAHVARVSTTSPDQGDVLVLAHNHHAP